jgi:segregation and condensation protein A
VTDYKVALDVYNGPLDLLLFLIRREEIDIYDIPIARITEQYLQYVEVLRQLDPEIVSEFLVLAATLMEIKSRTLLPTPPAEEMDEDIADPRLELVRQLLEYKKYKDVAYTLEEAAGEQSRKYARRPALPPRPEDEIELDNLQIWDLFDAFNRLLEQTGRRGAMHQVEVDDTPVALHAEDIVDSIERAGGGEKFEDIFVGRSRGEMIGLFLALLELIRQQRVQATQERPFGPILIVLLDPTPLDEIDESGVDETVHGHDADAPVGDPDAQAKRADGQEEAVSIEVDDGHASDETPTWADDGEAGVEGRDSVEVAPSDDVTCLEAKDDPE